EQASTWAGVVFTEAEITDRLTEYGFDIVELRGQGSLYFMITAVRKPKVSIPASTLASYIGNNWNEPSVSNLLARCHSRGLDVSMSSFLQNSNALERLATLFIEDSAHLSNEEFLKEGYYICLARFPDEEGMNGFLGDLK